MCSYTNPSNDDVHLLLEVRFRRNVARDDEGLPSPFFYSGPIIFSGRTMASNS